MQLNVTPDFDEGPIKQISFWLSTRQVILQDVPPAPPFLSPDIDGSFKWQTWVIIRTEKACPCFNAKIRHSYNYACFVSRYVYFL